MRLGMLIRKWRIISEITAHDLAKEIGISPATLNRFELGQSVNSESMTKVLTWSLGVPAVAEPTAV